MIVTDTTPNDGVLDDDINTIQLVGTNPKTTYVTGEVRASATNLTTGTIPFNELIATSGVRSIELNGFTLTNQVSPGGDHAHRDLPLGGVRRCRSTASWPSSTRRSRPRRTRSSRAPAPRR